MKRETLTPRGSGRRTIIAAVSAFIVVAAVAIPILASSAQGSTPSSDINDYALYATNTLQLKGGGLDGQSIIDGNIGAGTKHFMPGNIDEYTLATQYLRSTNKLYGPSPILGDDHMTLCQGAGGNGHLDVHGYVVAPSMDIQFNSTCKIPDAYGLSNVTAVSPASWHTITSASAPDITMPALPAINCSAAVPQPASLTLPAGTYTDVHVTTKDLQLSAGVYNICGTLTVDQNAMLLTQPDTVINITQNLNSLGGGTGQVGACGTTFNVVGDVNFGRGGNVSGTFIAPNDDVALGRSTNITGHVWALAMHSDWGASVSKCPPDTSTTLPPTTAPPTTAPPTTAPPTTAPPTTAPPTTAPPTTAPPTTAPPTTAPPTTAPPTTAPPTTAPPTTAPPTTEPPTNPPTTIGET